ncbi:MAG: nucleotidyltransferase family protein [Candidatus Omnitrophica bacterium]|nr:nucleotidyltransferase family protein [Candidatus Omnitrophota bacterium]
MLDFSGLIRALAEKFSRTGVRYALIGGMALHAAGLTRATGDIDLLVHADDADKLRSVLLETGFKVFHEDENVLQAAVPWLPIGGVDVIWSRRQYSRDMLARRVSTPDGIYVVDPEGIIGLKVQAIANAPERRLSDAVDIEWLLRTHSQSMNMALVREYFALFSMTAELENILTRIKENRPC